MDNEMNRRRLLTLSAVCIPIVSGCVGDGTEDETVRNENSENSDSNVIFEEGQSHSFEGSGPSETERFELNRGAMLYEFESTIEDGIFTSELVDLDRNNPSDLIDSRSLTNYVSPLEGELMNVVSGGEYIIDVDVEGDWSISIEQPAITRDDVDDVPFEADGDSSESFGPIELPEGEEVQATHSGENSFQINSITTDGRWDVPVNESGEEDVTRTFRDDGVAWINIIADDSWTVEIE